MQNLSRYISLLFSLLVVGHLSVGAQILEEEREFIVYDASNGLADNSAQAVICINSGRLMVTTIGNVNFFDGARFTLVNPKNADTYPLRGYDGSYQVFQDKIQHLWIKNDHMMSCVDLKTETFVKDLTAELRRMGVNRKVDDFYGDSHKRVWFRMGQQIYSPQLNRTFDVRSHADLQDIDVFRDSLLLMFHGDGSVDQYDFKSGKFMRHDVAYDEKDRRRFGSFSDICLLDHTYYQLRSGQNESVLLSYDVQSHSWQRLLERPFLMNVLCNKGDSVYVGTERGYFVYDARSGKHQHYEALKLTKGRTQVSHIISMTFDKQGGLWLGTRSRGLLYSKPHNVPLKAYLLGTPEGNHYQQLLAQYKKPSVKPLPRKTICELTDSRGWQWIGSYHGLKIERPDGTTQQLSVKDGLPNAVIHAIVEDKHNDIWVSTSFGICHVFLRRDSIFHLEPYISQDHVPNEMFLNEQAATLPDGTIVMQSIDHMLVFHPDHFQGANFGMRPMRPKLVRLSINGNRIEAGTELDGDVILDVAVARTREIRVNYRQNTLSMVFSGQNYMRPAQTNYRIRIKGLPQYEDWRILSYGTSEGAVDKYGQLHLLLAGLEPGDYTIEMQTSMWKEVWLGEPQTWTISVKQPWWRSTGIYVLLAVVLLVLLALNLSAYSRNVRLRLVTRNSERDLVRILKLAAARCQSFESDPITQETLVSEITNLQNAGLSPDFVAAMLRIIPYIIETNKGSYRLTELASVAGISSDQLCDLLATHVDKNPRLLMLPLRLDQVATLLRTTSKTLEEIAAQCRFSSVNLMISTFYHRYKLTPANYRKAK